MLPSTSCALRLAAALFLAAATSLVVQPQTAFAFGSSSDESSPSVSELIDQAEAHIDKWEYTEAVDLLEQALDEDANNPDVLNYLGYCHRKLGDPDTALEYYLAALAEEPDHLGANEYLGELYLEMEQLEKAEERLAVLADSCNSDCEEYDELNQAIADYKEMHGIS